MPNCCYMYAAVPYTYSDSFCHPFLTGHEPVADARKLLDFTKQLTFRRTLMKKSDDGSTCCQAYRQSSSSFAHLFPDVCWPFFVLDLYFDVWDYSRNRSHYQANAFIQSKQLSTSFPTSNSAKYHNGRQRTLHNCCNNIIVQHYWTIRHIKSNKFLIV